MKLFLRAVVLTVLRFIALLILLIFVQNFEVSPLPDWTLVAFAYLMDLIITYLFARWVFRKQDVNWPGVATVAAVFVVGQMLLEAGLQYFISPTTTTWLGLLTSYTWQSLLVIGAYLVAVFVAGWQKIKKNRRAVNPAGRSVSKYECAL